MDDEGNSWGARRIDFQNREAIFEMMRALQPFRAVIEATGTYRWLYNLLRPLETVLLAHPLRLRAMVQRRSKTDKLDSQLLANLLRINQIPRAYIPPEKPSATKPQFARLDFEVPGSRDKNAMPSRIGSAAYANGTLILAIALAV